jgi:hypothetical protein
MLDYGNQAMQSITTKYLGPTSSRGAHILARATGGVRLTRPWDYSTDQDDNHRNAALALASRLRWFGDWWGATLNKNGNVYVCISEPATEAGFHAAPVS